jgi:hypothetical protein
MGRHALRFGRQCLDIPGHRRSVRFGQIAVDPVALIESSSLGDFSGGAKQRSARRPVVKRSQQIASFLKSAAANTRQNEILLSSNDMAHW